MDLSGPALDNEAYYPSARLSNQGKFWELPLGFWEFVYGQTKKASYVFEKMVGPVGLEPTTKGL